MGQVAPSAAEQAVMVVVMTVFMAMRMVMVMAVAVAMMMMGIIAMVMVRVAVVVHRLLPEFGRLEWRWRLLHLRSGRCNQDAVLHRPQCSAASRRIDDQLVAAWQDLIHGF